MNAHLNDQQFGDFVLGVSKTVADHVDSCNLCYAEVEGLRTAIARYRQSVHKAAERNEIFWSKQRLAIRHRIGSHRFVLYFRWAAATATLLVSFALFLLTRAPQPVQRATSDLQDDILLRQVQNDIGRGYPVALAPAALIDEARNSALSASARTQVQRRIKKEHQQ